MRECEQSTELHLRRKAAWGSSTDEASDAGAEIQAGRGQPCIEQRSLTQHSQEQASREQSTKLMSVLFHSHPSKYLPLGGNTVELIATLREIVSAMKDLYFHSITNSLRCGKRCRKMFFCLKACWDHPAKPCVENGLRWVCSLKQNNCSPHHSLKCMADGSSCVVSHYHVCTKVGFV